MRIYYGMNEDTTKVIMATITGEMSDGTKVYTEIETRDDGSMVKDENGDPKLILDNQYTRHLKHGTQTFSRI
jgi:hypothetical protein